MVDVVRGKLASLLMMIPCGGERGLAQDDLSLLRFVVFAFTLSFVSSMFTMDVAGVHGEMLQEKYPTTL